MVPFRIRLLFLAVLGLGLIGTAGCSQLPFVRTPPVTPSPTLVLTPMTGATQTNPTTAAPATVPSSPNPTTLPGAPTSGVPANTTVRPTTAPATAVAPTAVPPTAVPPTAVPPTAVPPSPVPTQRPPTVPAPTATTSAANTARVKIFMIAIDDNGRSGKKIGCNDSVVAVDRAIRPTTALLRTALNELLALHDRDYGQSGLYNALYQSRLTLQDVTIVNAVANIKLAGTLTQGGECDSPRIKAQLEETALQFATVRSTAITLNGTPLDQVLSLK